MEVLNVGHTANMARYIQEYTGGVLFEIEPEVSYEDPYSSVLERARQEIDNNTRPAIKSLLENLDQYSVVFVGSPIWYGRPPMIMQTFYEAYPELANKTLIPFGTHEGSGISSCTSTMRQYFPNATMLESYGLRGQEVSNSRSNVEAWLERIGIPKKE